MKYFPRAAALLLAAAALAAAPASHAQKKRVSQKGAASQQAGPPYSSREEVMRFAEDVAQRRDLDPAWVRQAVGNARLLPLAARLMQPAPAGTPKNWRVYRSRFIDPIRIAAGVRFWQENRQVLERAEAAYGVPAEMIVGIIGVETIYGQQMGTFRVIDALATLAFDFPQSHPRAKERAEFFRGELEQFLTLQSRTGGDPSVPVGSYAGAMGMPQFMPSSWNKYAVDFDGDGRIDLAGSAADSIGSVANYFKAFGWQTGMPTHYAVALDGTPQDKEALLVPDILPTFSVASFTAKGAVGPGPPRAPHGPRPRGGRPNGPAPPRCGAGTAHVE
ncbi:MAG: lytic murein transglycosylase, partial [Burkholderiaceae bacterium]